MTITPVRLISVGSLARVDAHLNEAVDVGEAAGNGICLVGQGVAPRHARIIPLDGNWMVQPSSSTQTTRLNGDPIEGSAVLVHLDVLSFGDVDLVFVDRPVPAPAPAPAPVRADDGVTVLTPLAPRPTPPVVAVTPPVENAGASTVFSPRVQAPSPPPNPLGASATPSPESAGDKTSFSPVVQAPAPPPALVDRPVSSPMAGGAGGPDDETSRGLIRLSGPAGTWTLKPGRNTIGRSPDCDVFVNLRQVSREHAALVLAGGVVIEHLGGQNGTTVNGKNVVEPMALRSGDRLAFADVEFTLVIE